jgi:hypothetical protein
MEDLDHRPWPTPRLEERESRWPRRCPTPPVPPPYLPPLPLLQLVDLSHIAAELQLVDLGHGKGPVAKVQRRPPRSRRGQRGRRE